MNIYVLKESTYAYFNGNSFVYKENNCRCFSSLEKARAAMTVWEPMYHREPLVILSDKNLKDLSTRYLTYSYLFIDDQKDSNKLIIRTTLTIQSCKIEDEEE